MNRVPLRIHNPIRSNRSGSTLTEVLITILIMSIGLVGVMSLFPASVLRSVQAHALTTAANLRLSAEAAIAANPEIIADADRTPGVNSDTNGDGNRWNDQAGSVYMVDPFFVFTTSTPSGTPIAGAGTIPRFHAGFTTLTGIENVFSSPDKWTIRHEEFPINGSLAPAASPQSLTFKSLSDQQVFLGTAAAPIPTRLVIFNKAGNGCQVRTVDPALNTAAPLGNSVSWSKALPGSYSNAAFASADIGNVRVEQRDLHFTWALTARGMNNSNMNAPTLKYEAFITVFYKRGYPPGDSIGYGNGPDLVFRQGSSDIRVVYAPPALPAPFLKKGSWVLDATNGLWYEIENYVDDGVGAANITLATPARENGASAVFMKAIVDVYRINTVTINNPPRQ